MHPLLALLGPLALFLPVVGGDTDPSAERGLLPAPDSTAANPAVGETIEVFDFVDGANVQQVRIEQRVTIRIAPRDPAVRPSMLAEMAPRSGGPAQTTERKMGKCVPISGIAAVQPESGRLLLFMRDQRLVSAGLEKSCRAREFYAGFYLERNGDGLLCVDRDRLHSRAGASCKISRMRQVVAKAD
jgi:hypothetical protein